MTEKIEFDTHRFVKNLTACGFTEKQAEVLADEQARLLNRNLATKADLEKFKAILTTDLERFNADLKAEIRKVSADLEVRIETVNADLEVRIEAVNADLGVRIETVNADLGARIEAVKADLGARIEAVKADVERVKSDLLKWMVGAMSAQTALIAGLILGLVQFA